MSYDMHRFIVCDYIFVCLPTSLFAKPVNYMSHSLTYRHKAIEMVVLQFSSVATMVPPLEVDLINDSPRVAGGFRGSVEAEFTVMQRENGKIVCCSCLTLFFSIPCRFLRQCVILRPTARPVCAQDPRIQ